VMGVRTSSTLLVGGQHWSCWPLAVLDGAEPGVRQLGARREARTGRGGFISFEVEALCQLIALLQYSFINIRGDHALVNEAFN
jgi:hypothetical protein